jgi:23S rRNA (cytosine1962-C5)-methyltransferase
MQEDKFIMFHNRLQKVHRHRDKIARRLGVSCYRVYDHDLPEFPFSIEIYDQQVHLAEYKRNHRMNEDEYQSWLEQSVHIIGEVLQVKKENIFYKIRRRKEGRAGQYKKSGDEGAEFMVTENGLKFIVNLSDYLDTGLFLDHRVTREMIKKSAGGKRVLNLFAYTGSFSVYAAAGGAVAVDTVDLSRTYLSWAERNMQINGFIDKEKYRFIQADVLQYLKTLPEKSFDLVIMDPPTFSNSKRMEDILDIQRDHVMLINECIKALDQGGILYFSTNYKKFILEKEKIQARSTRDITKQTTPFDFEGRLFRYCFCMEK